MFLALTLPILQDYALEFTDAALHHYDSGVIGIQFRSNWWKALEDSQVTEELRK